MAVEEPKAVIRITSSPDAHVEPSQELDPVLVGQLDVHHHQVGQVLRDVCSICLGAALAKPDRVPLFAQEILEQGTDVRLVIDYEHGPFGFGRHPRPPPITWIALARE